MSRLNLKLKGKQYTDIQIATNQTGNKFAREVSTEYRQSFGGFISVRGIQKSTKTASSRWLLYSHWGMNPVTIKEEIEKRVGLEVALPFRKIPSLKNGNCPLDVKAWAVEFAEENLDKGNQLIDKIFSANKKSKLSIGRMRAIPTYNKCTTREMEAAIRMHKRQEAFLANMQSMTTSDIRYLDKVDLTTRKTLCNMILRIPRRDKPEHKLFFNVKRRSGPKEQTIIFFHPKLKAQAQAMINELLPYLKHTYGNEVSHFFTETHQKHCKGMRWDPKNKGVWTKQVEAMELALNKDKDNWENLGKVDTGTNTRIEVNTIPRRETNKPWIGNARTYDVEGGSFCVYAQHKGGQGQANPKESSPKGT